MTDAHRDHPAHDLLAALPHDSLTDEERRALFSHLAECADCRHSVMFLAEEPFHKPEPGLRIWHRLAIGAVAATVIAAIAFTSLNSTGSRSQNHAGLAGTVDAAGWKGRGFQHVSLTRTGDSGGTGDLIVHLAGFKPKGNQVVVRSQYGERWLTFDSFLSFASNDGPVSTVN